jgi:hypothetical protein
MKTVDVEMTITIAADNGVTIGTLLTLEEALTERFPWVLGALVEAVVYPTDKEVTR